MSVEEAAAELQAGVSQVLRGFDTGVQVTVENDRTVTIYPDENGTIRIPAGGLLLDSGVYLRGAGNPATTVARHPRPLFGPRTGRLRPVALLPETALTGRGA